MGNKLCQCGQPATITGKCQKCYNRDRYSLSLKPKELCACGNTVFAKRLCSRCYFRQNYSKSKIDLNAVKFDVMTSNPRVLEIDDEKTRYNALELQDKQLRSLEIIQSATIGEILIFNTLINTVQAEYSFIYGEVIQARPDMITLKDLKTGCKTSVSTFELLDKDVRVYLERVAEELFLR